jgi:hypothetical protein
MTVQLLTRRGNSVDIGDDDAECEKYKYGQNEIIRMVEWHNCAPLTDACLTEGNVDVSAAPGFDPGQDATSKVSPARAGE